MASMGLKAPSPAWLARLFRREGVARAEPSKRPRAAWRRFVYPAPNACWQLDATEYVLAGGRKAVIFQLQDDHSRLAVASLVAPGETSQAAIDVFDRGVAARGVPQRPRGRQRRGPGPQPARSHRPPGRGTCAPWASNPPPANPTTPPPRARTSASTRPCSATRTSSPWPTPSPSSRSRSTASTTPCNTQRPHQGLPGRITPQQAWDATEIAQAPRPRHDTGPIAPAGPSPEPDTTDGPRVRWRRPIGSTGRRELTIARNGTAHIGGIAFLVNRALAGSKTIAIWDADTITFADVHGEVLIQYNWPPQGTAYVSHHPPDPTNQRARPRPQKAPTVTEVLTHRTSPMS